jgi:3-keto-5-aminohexanoate cleavage enzyme
MAITVPVIIEAAINGATSKRKNANVPIAPEEIAADALACFDAGAAIVHNHVDKLMVSGEESAARYLDGWRPVLAARPDALLYPTVNAGATVEDSYCHLEPLVRDGGLRVGLCDPGSVNFGALDGDGVPRGGFVYRNSHEDVYYQMELCRRLRLGPQLAIFEPGFLRAALAWWRAGRLAPGAMIKLYFGGDNGYLGGAGSGVPFGLPPTRASLDAYLQMFDGCDVPWSAAVIGGDLTGDAAFVRAVLDAGGHLHVGLEDFSGERAPTNVELVREAVSIIELAGRSPATPTEAAEILQLPHARGER